MADKLTEEQEHLAMIAALLASGLQKPDDVSIGYSPATIARRAVAVAKAILTEVRDSSTN